MPAPPATALQERLLGIVGEVLGVAVAGDGGPAGIGVEDDFFELGGHSLLAVHAVMRVNAALGMDLPVRSLFEAPTVAALSVLIEGRAGESGGPARRPIPRLDRSRHLVRGAG